MGEHLNLASWEGWLTFDGIVAAQQIAIPTMIVHSEAAAIPHGAQAFMPIYPVKNQHWLADVGQFDFYDNDAGSEGGRSGGRRNCCGISSCAKRGQRSQRHGDRHC